MSLKRIALAKRAVASSLMIQNAQTATVRVSLAM